MGARAEAPTIYERQLILLEDNTLKANIMPSLPYKFAVYGTLTGIDDIRVISDVITCESGWNQREIGKAGEIGMGQYLPLTWAYFNKLRGTNLDIKSGSDQLDMTIWAFRNGYQCHWSCYKLLFPNECPKNSATDVANPIKVVEE